MPKVLEKNTISAKNAKFNALSRAEKRVTIAKDVLKQMKGEKINIETGDYCEIDTYKDKDKIMQVDEAIKEGKVKCKVCAKGALFISHIMFTNHIKIIDITDHLVMSDEIVLRLKGIFSVNQLNLIETAFEREIITDKNNYLREKYNGYSPKPIARKAIAFGNKYGHDEDRLEAIVKNIIKNEGTFKP